MPMLQPILQSALHQFGTVTSEIQSGFESVHNYETKFVIHQPDLPFILKQAINYYGILQMQNMRIFTERVLYFDTEDKKFYRDHFNRGSMRVNVGMRQTMELDLCFLEVECKHPDGNTRRTNVKISRIEPSLSEYSSHFITRIGKINELLMPSLHTMFNRFTLVSDLLEEKITIDYNLRLPGNRTFARFSDLVVIEVRQQDPTSQSPIMTALQSLEHHPSYLGKYCIGLMSLDKRC